MVRRIAKLGLRALILLSALGAVPGPAAQSPAAQPPACETIAFGTAIDRELSLGEKRCFTFNASAGQFVQALVEQRGIDVIVSIFGQGGEALPSVDRMSSVYWRADGWLVWLL